MIFVFFVSQNVLFLIRFRNVISMWVVSHEFLYHFLLEDIAAGKRERAEFRARSYERFVHFWKFVRAFVAINLYIAPAFGNFYDL